MIVAEERTRCWGRVGMTRAQAYAHLREARDAGFGSKLTAKKCKSCGRWHVWPKADAT